MFHNIEIISLTPLYLQTTFLLKIYKKTNILHLLILIEFT